MRLRSILLTSLVLGSVLSAPAALAQWSAGGVSICGAACQPDIPITIPDGQGGVFVGWRDLRTYSVTHADVYLQRITAAGRIAPGWPSGGLPVCDLLEDQEPTSLAADGQGGVFVVWIDLREQGPNGVDLYAQRIRGDGTLAPGWPLDGAPVTRAPGQQSVPVIVADGAGGALVVWDDYRDYLLTDFDVYAQHLTASGAVAAGWPRDGLPVCVLEGAQGLPRALPDGAGGVIMVWIDERGGLYGQRLHGDGTVAAGWDANGSLLAPGRSKPEMAADGAGGFYLSDVTLGQYGLDQEFFLHRFTLDGVRAAGWPAGGVLVCGAPDYRTGLEIAPDDRGGLVLAWYDYRLGASEIYAARVLPDGARPWTVDGVRVSSTQPWSNESDVDIIGDGAGGGYITWEREITSKEVLVQHLTAHGEVAPGWPAGGLKVTPNSIIQFDPVLAPDGAGGAIVVWEQRDALDLLAQRFQLDGPVAVQLALASVEAEPDRVVLAWYGPGAGALAARVERRIESGEWSSLGPAQPDGADRLRYADRTVSAGGRYGYRLAYVEDGSARFTAETWVEVPRALELALEGFRPNPVVGPATVAFTLPDGNAARLEVSDITGRRVLAREVGSLGAGRHVLRLDGSGRLAPGVYLVRLIRGGRVSSARGVVMR